MCMKVSLLVFSMLLALALPGLGELAVGWAEAGRDLASLLSSYAPVELYRQRLALWRLSGGEPPSAEHALAALGEVGQRLSELGALLLTLPGGEGAFPALQTASTVLPQLATVVGETGQGLEELPAAELDEFMTALEGGRRALDDLLLAAADAAAAAGGGWEFQTAFLAQSVLLSPSPLYLRIQEEWAVYLRQNAPPGTPPGVVAALEELLTLANRGLSLEQEETARAAARAILDGLL